MADKHPDRVRGGQTTARLRWGVPGPLPDRVTLVGLNDEQRATVIEMVKVLREQNQKREATQ